ncbi:MAG: alginate lyase family protein [Bacilli bacterium]|nr:alginate lyase family protein [Bacilli bacterium]
MKKNNHLIDKFNYHLKRILGLSFHDCHLLFINPKKNSCLNVYLANSLEDISLMLNSEKSLKEKVLDMVELTLNNKFLILNKIRDDVYDVKNKHYIWNYDFYASYKFKDCFYLDARKVNVPGTGFDIKVPWEISRMEYLFSLAMAFRINKEEKYASKIFEIVNDFRKENPYNSGVNWDISMEVGIRLANIILATELVQDSKAYLKNRKALIRLTYEHVVHIKKNLENKRNPNNHYLGDLLGLAVGYASYPYLFNKKDIDFVINETHKEIKRQILPDGVDFEGSTSYQRLTGEIIAFTLIPLLKLGFKVDEQEKELIKKMCEFTINIMDGNHLVSKLADNDSGRVFQLFLENDSNHSFYLNALLPLATNQMFDYQYLINSGGFIFVSSKDEYKYEAKELSLYEHSKIAVYKNDLYSLLFTASIPEINQMPGHAHNDILSFVLKINNKEFITDPGTGEYTSSEEKRNLFRTIKNHSTVSIDDNEQRIFPPSSFDSMFDWETKLNESKIKIGNKTISGEINYFDEDKNSLKHSREIRLSEKEISIIDRVSGMKNNCKLYLPIHPEIKIEIIDEHTFRLKSKNIEATIKGTWSFSLTKGVYAYQYKDYVDSVVVVGYSEKEENSFQIMING